MKHFFSFIKKEFFHIIRDRRTMLIVLGMPVMQILLFGFAINMDVENVRVAVYDPANDETSREIIDHISANPYFIMMGEAHSMGEIESSLMKGKIDVAVVFENNFQTNFLHAGKAQIQIISDTSDPNTGSIGANYVMAIVGDFQRQMMGSHRVPYGITVESALLYNPELHSAFNFVPGIMGLVMMVICTIMTSISIVREKERGTMEVLLASPLRSSTVLLAKAIPYLGLSLVNLASILLLAVFVLHVPVRGSLLLLLGVSTIFIFLSLSIGLLVSTIVKTQITAILVSGIGMIMPVLILSGMIFPIGNMPVPLQWVSAIVPARWFIAAVKKIMIEGLDFMSVAKEVLILTGMSAVLTTASIKNIKSRLE